MLIGVRLLDLPYHLDNEYTYFVESELEKEVELGKFICVPFGRSNKKHQAVIVSINPQCDYDTIKPILYFMDNTFSLDSKDLGLVEYIVNTCLCSYGDAVRRIIPSDYFNKEEEFYLANENYESLDLDAVTRSVIKKVYEQEGMSKTNLLKLLRTEDEKKIDKLVLENLLVLTSKKDSGSMNAIVYSTDALENGFDDIRLTNAQREILEIVYENDGVWQSDITSNGYSSAQIKALAKRGLVRIEKEEQLKNPYSNLSQIEHREIILSSDQEKAKSKLLSLIEDKKPHAALLHGVTGSGKTSVVISLCQDIIKDNKTAIILVPEIALTWQSVAAFASVFGNRLAVIHSKLAGRERIDTLKRIKYGEVDVVLGTRSAIFAPIKNLGIIVIDEEQESTYKSEQTPKYHAKDIARYRCAKENALMLLCSATPSIESYAKARNGTYTLVELKGRYGTSKLPSVLVSDMRNETGIKKCIGEALNLEIENNLKAGEQTILFLNRRGYNKYLICRQCGESIVCPRCSITLTHHKKKNGNGILSCHYCGYFTHVPSLCPSCGGEHLDFGGSGIQKLEEELNNEFPNARIMRMDADTTKQRFSQDEICEKFRNGEADILIGTQMVTKGHNFPNVSLVGVISADDSLHMDDFRANERTFSLITQVVGRAGRSIKPGRAIIQTSKPDNEIIKLASKQDFVAFFEDEAALRKAVSFPPYCDIVLIDFSGYDEEKVARVANEFSVELQKLSKEKEYSKLVMQGFGPFEASIYKINEKFRIKMVIKCNNTPLQREFFSKLMKQFGKFVSKDLFINIDINPTIV